MPPPSLFRQQPTRRRRAPRPRLHQLLLLVVVVVVVVVLDMACAFVAPLELNPSRCRPLLPSLLPAATADGGEGSSGMRPLLTEGIDVRPAADGLGPGAGRILVAKPWEYNHFTSKVVLRVLGVILKYPSVCVSLWLTCYMYVYIHIYLYTQSCLFVYQHDPETGSRAVVLERPTAFTLAELAPPFAESVFAEHTVFLGGEVRF